MKLPRSPALRALLVVAAAFVVLVVAAWIALAVAFPPSKVRAMVSARLSETLAREVRFDDASIGLFPPVRLAVRGLAIAEPGGFDAGAAVRVKSLNVDLDPFGLLFRRVVLRRLELDGPAVHLVMHPDGTTNFDGIAAAPAGEGAGAGGAAAGTPMDVAISVLAVRDGRVLIDDLAAGTRRAFAVNSRLGLSLERGGERIALDGATTLSDVRFGTLSDTRLEDMKQGLGGLDWEIEHRGKLDVANQRLALDRLALKLGRAEIAASGLIEEPGAHARLDLHARATHVDLADVLGWLAEADARALSGISGAGQLAFDLDVTGTLGPDRLPSLRGRVAILNGAFRYPGAPAGVEDLSFVAHLAPDSLVIDNLTASIEGQSVRARLLATHFEDPWVRFMIQGDLSLAAITPLVAPPGVSLGGRAAVSLEGAGRAKAPEAMKLDGRAALSNVSVESPDLPKRVDSVEGAIEFSGDRARVRNLSAKAGASSFTLDATVTNPLAITAKPGEKPPADVDFTLKSPHLDLAELLPATPGSPLTPNARGGGRVGITRLIKDKLDVTNVAARVTLSPGVVTVPEFSLDGYGGHVGGDARFDLTDPAVPVYAVKARVDSVRADALLSRWTPVKGLIEGALSSSFDLSGAGTTPQDVARTLTAVGLATLTQGAIGPTPALKEIADVTGVTEFAKPRFRNARVPFRVEQGKVVTDDVALSGPTGEWKLAGAVGFDGALDYAVSVTVAPEIVKQLGANAALAAGALSDDQGRVLVDLKVGGNVKKPRVALDTQATGERIAGRISSSLKEQGKKLERDLLDAIARDRSGDSTVTDSARSAVKKDIVDDLKRIKARDVLKGFFGGGTKDTTK